MWTIVLQDCSLFSGKINLSWRNLASDVISITYVANRPEPKSNVYELMIVLTAKDRPECTSIISSNNESQIDEALDVAYEVFSAGYYQPIIDKIQPQVEQRKQQEAEARRLKAIVEAEIEAKRQAELKKKQQELEKERQEIESKRKQQELERQEIEARARASKIRAQQEYEARVLQETIAKQKREQEELKEQERRFAEWLSGRRKDKATILKTLSMQIRQEPDNPNFHYELALQLLSILLPQIEDEESNFWDAIPSYQYDYPEFVEAREHLNLILAIGVADSLIAAKTKYFLITLILTQKSRVANKETFEEFPALGTLVHDMVKDTKKHLRTNPYSIQTLKIQKAAYSALGDRSGIGRVEQSLVQVESLLNAGLIERAPKDSKIQTAIAKRNDGIEFEEKIRRLLSAMGLKTTTTRVTGDGGIDVLAYSESPVFAGKYIVQCKDWATTSVGEPVIRDLFGVVMAESANKGILITTGQITASARRFAEGKQLELIDGNDLQSLLRRYKVD
jgi:HJR/Mrr/RecB family endonuclease